jgi:KDO2-lipid IV(A) lauroyltransferase
MPSLLAWLSHRSLRFLHVLGAWLGWTAYLLSPSYRRRLVQNAQLAGVSRAERRAAVAEAGKLYAELPRLWLRPRDQPIGDPVRWQGAELVESALAAGRGLVLLTPHLGTFEICAQAYAARFGGQQPITVLYRPARQPWLRELEETARTRPALATAPASLAGVRQMMRALRKGETLGLLPDQVPPEGMGVWAPFFGQPAYTMTLAARLVLQTGSAWLLIWSERLPQGNGYIVHVQAPAETLPARGEQDEEAWMAAAAGVVNRAMETLIRQKPAQYLWGYNRYKQPRRLEAP